MKIFMLLVVLISELIAIRLIFNIWRSGEHRFFKVFGTLFVLIPVIGLAFYFMLFNMPPTLEGEKKDMKHHRRGDFARSWVHGGKEEMQRKIREAQAKLERDEKKKKH